MVVAAGLQLLLSVTFGEPSGGILRDVALVLLDRRCKRGQPDVSGRRRRQRSQADAIALVVMVALAMSVKQPG